MIRDLHKRMRELAIRAGVNIKRYDELVVLIDVLEPDDRLSFAKRFQRLEAPWQRAYDIWKQNPKEMWDRYQFYDLRDANEVILLTAALKTFKVIFNEEFRKKNSKGLKRSKVQPPEAGTVEGDC